MVVVSLQGLIVLVFWKSLEFPVVVVSLLVLVVQVSRNEEVLGLVVYRGDHEA